MPNDKKTLIIQGVPEHVINDVLSRGNDESLNKKKPFTYGPPLKDEPTNPDHKNHTCEWVPSEIPELEVFKCTDCGAILDIREKVQEVTNEHRCEWVPDEVNPEVQICRCMDCGAVLGYRTLTTVTTDYTTLTYEKPNIENNIPENINTPSKKLR